MCSRIASHKTQKRKNSKRQTTSHKLDLENCEIRILEECDYRDTYERERYWIDKIDCVNILKNTYDRNSKKYKQAARTRSIEWTKNNKQRKLDYNRIRHHYIYSWGGNHNNLLQIDVNIFI